MYLFSCNDIFDAISSNDPLEVEKFIKQGQIENNDDRNLTPLMYALSLKKYAIAGVLINNGCEVNCMNKEKETPLHKIVQLIFGYNSCDNRGINYIYNDEFNILELLLKKGAETNRKDYAGRTPIFYIGNNVRYAGPEIPIDPEIMELIDQIDFDFKYKKESKPEKQTGKDRKGPGILKIFLEKNKDLIKKCDEEVKESMEKFKKEMKANNLVKQVNLRMVMNKYIFMNTIRRLLEHGARLDISDVTGKTVFHYAASDKSSDVLKYLLECTSAATKRNFKRKRRALTDNPVKGDSFQELYIKPEINRKDRNKKTPLHYALNFRNISAEKIILKSLFDDSIVEKLEKLNFFKRGRDVLNPIGILIDNDYKDILNLYLDEFGNSIIKKAPQEKLLSWEVALDWLPPLILAVEKKNINIAASLLSKNFTGNYSSRKFTGTLLHVFENGRDDEKEFENIIRLYISRIKEQRKSIRLWINEAYWGNTPLSIAGDKGLKRIEKLLIENGAK